VPTSTASAAPAASLPDPTGPVGLPLGLGIVDPLGPSQPENPPTVQQPDPSVYPIFDTVDGYGWFGSGFARGGVPSRSPQRVGIAVGGDATTGGRIYVLSTLTNQVSMYDLTSPPAITAMNASAFNNMGWSSTQSIAYYRQEVYILGVDGTNTQVVRVFDADGNYRRTIQLGHVLQDEGYTGNLGTRYSGLAVAFGEVWLTHPGNSDQAGQDVVVYDAQTGAFKGRSQQPLGGVQSPSYRSWWDISIAPELGGGIVDRRFISQGPLEAADAIPGSPKCLGGASANCTSGAQQGTDAVWGMRWFMDLSSPTGNSTYRPVEEFSIDQQTIGSSSWPFSLLPGGGFSIGVPGYYLTPQRTWNAQQAANGDPVSLSDLFFNNRALRIDWAGYPTTSQWVRGANHCIPYVVSDGDIFIVGDKGERWYQPARGFQQIQFLVDGVVKATFTTPSGSWCMDTTQYADGTHTLKAIATVDGGRQVTKTNENLHIDNTQPTGSILTSLGTYSRASINMAGTLSDASAGPYDWTLQISPAGQNSYTNVPGCAVAANPSGAYACSWDTTKFADGAYTLRAQLRDAALDSNGHPGNTSYTTVLSTTVDNTPPSVANMAPDINESTYEEVPDPTTSVDWTQTDNPGGSGVNQTTIYVNTATDGSDSGAWEPTGSSSATGDAHVSWDPTQRDGGLYRFRADACDQAGNCSRTEWQAVLASQARRFPQCPENEGGHCYAGEKLGYPNPFDPNGTGLGYAIQTNLTTPAPVAHQTAQEFSTNYINLGGGSTLQVGLTTPSPKSSQENACGRVGSGPTDRWYQYIELTRGSKGFIYCPRTPVPTGSVHSYKVAITHPGSTYYAQGSWDGVVQAIRVLGSRRVYWLGSRGTSDLQAAGEATNRSRELAGRYTGLQVYEETGSGLADPNYSTPFRDFGFERHGSATNFCVTDSRRKVQHGCG
jgi:hypothetical protein